jgi:hypothetical protein
MNFRFEPERELILVRAVLVGPSGSAILRLALDTGATSTLINADMVRAIGYDLDLAAERVSVTTGSGVEQVPVVSLKERRATATASSSNASPPPTPAPS